MTLDDRPTTRRLLRLSPSRGGGTGQSLLAVRNCRQNNDSRPARYARRLSPHARPRRRALYLFWRASLIRHAMSRIQDLAALQMARHAANVFLYHALVLNPHEGEALRD